MTKSIFKRGMSGLLAVLMCFSALIGIDSTTAFAASEVSEAYMISFHVTETATRYTAPMLGDTPQKTT